MTRAFSARFIFPDPNNADLCLSCYLPECYADGLLENYCPINVARKFNLSAETVAPISKATGENNRWKFVAQVRAASEVT